MINSFDHVLNSQFGLPIVIDAKPIEVLTHTILNRMKKKEFHFFIFCNRFFFQRLNLFPFVTLTSFY